MKSNSGRIVAVAVVLSLLLVGSLCANALLYLRYSTSRPLVTVAGEVITKKQYQDQLESQSGQDVLNKMVMTRLIMRAAAQAGVTPTPQDVDAQIAEMERRTPQVLTPYMQDSGKMAAFKQDLAAQIALENLRIEQVPPGSVDVRGYYARHKVEFVLPQQVKTTTVVANNTTDAATAADLLQQNVPSDVIARQPRLRVIGVNGWNPDLSSLSPVVKKQISKTLSAMKVGDVHVFQSGPLSLVVRVNVNSRVTMPPLEQVQGKAERLARLERAPSSNEMLARLYQSGKTTFNYDSDRYSSYFSAFQNYRLADDSGKKTASVP